MKRLKIGYLIDPIGSIHPEHDTSFALMKECARRRHEVLCCQLQDLRRHHSTVEARLTKCLPDPVKGLIPIGRPRWTALSRLDVFFIRKDPPFDMRYVSALALLGGAAERRDRLPVMINEPSGILATNEKLSVLDFRPFCPPGTAGSTPEAFLDFLKKPSRYGWVFKPLYFKGGRGVSRIRSNELNKMPALVRRLTRNGREPILCQRYIEHARIGDKRVLILDGRILGAMRRIPRAGEFRANLSRGAVAAPARVTRRDEAIVRRITPLLRRRGLHFVGIDVLSGYLSEINVTSPSGAPEVNAFNGGRVESAVIDRVERMVERRTTGGTLSAKSR